MIQQICKSNDLLEAAVSLKGRSSAPSLYVDTFTQNMNTNFELAINIKKVYFKMHPTHGVSRQTLPRPISNQNR